MPIKITAISSKPISREMFRARWRMLGHTLRMADDVPAKLTMLTFFNLTTKKNPAKHFAGRPRITLPARIDQDLVRIHQAAATTRRTLSSWTTSLPRRLTNISDLRSLEALASRRKRWIEIVDNAHTLLMQRETAP